MSKTFATFYFTFMSHCTFGMMDFPPSETRSLFRFVPTEPSLVSTSDDLTLRAFRTTSGFFYRFLASKLRPILASNDFSLGLLRLRFPSIFQLFRGRKWKFTSFQGDFRSAPILGASPRISIIFHPIFIAAKLLTAGR